MDVFVTKLSADGSQLEYSTYLGGSEDDSRGNIAVDVAGSAYVTGRTFSDDFPTTINAWDTVYSTSDAFVTKLNSTGTALEYSTYLGGTDGEHGFSISVASSGEALVVGHTSSSDFPVTSGAFDSTRDGYWDGFVTKFTADGSGLMFSTFLGGSSSDCEIGVGLYECTATMDTDGYIFITGTTFSSDFPITTDSFDTSYNGGEDAFVLKMTPDGSDLVYSTFLGGSGDDCFETCAIAIDTLGAAYVTGSTTSTDFPGAAGSYGGWDTFLVKVSPDGSNLSYSLRLGGAYDDIGLDVAVNTEGQAHVTGFSRSSDFPVTPDAFQQTLIGPRDVFVVKENSTGDGIIYSTLLGGEGDEIGYGLTVDDENLIYVTGWTNSGDFPLTPDAYQTFGGAFVTKFLLGYTTEVFDPSTRSSCGNDSGEDYDQRECPAILAQTQGYAGDPINTRNGGYFDSVEELSFATSAGMLAFQRTYSSQATDIYTTTLGYGWTHNHDTRLILSDDPGGQEGYVLFKAHSANQYRFLDNGNGTYTATPGVVSSLVFDSGLFELTDPSQRVYTFNEQGEVLAWKDAQGHGWTYTYASGRLDLITDDTGQRFLDFDYDPQGRLSRVADHTGRDVSFGYDTAGDLSTFTDVLDQLWIYTYDDQHRLRLITDPGDVIAVHTEYDELGRAYQQYDGTGTLVLEITYDNGINVVTDALGNQITHEYNSLNVFEGQLDSQGGTSEKTYDDNYRIETLTDANTHATQLEWSADGANLLQVIDAAAGQTDMSYDSLNNLTAVIDPLDYLTTYDYDGTLLISSTDAISNTTVYEYTTTGDYPQPAGLLKTVTDPLGRDTSYTYDQYGQRASVTDIADRTTTFEYDDLGRLITVVNPNGQSNWTCYDASGQVIRSVSNGSGDGSSPQEDPCDAVNYQPSVDPRYDRINTTVYDLHGNRIATIDPTGLISRTYYDTNNRLVTVVHNLTGQSIEDPSPPNYNPAYPDQNVRSDTVYDEAGNVIAMIDPLGIVTRTYYDSLNRQEYVVSNLVGQSIDVTNPPAYDPNFPDHNLLIETVYDPTGNLIATIDPLGYTTRTYYDSLNRPVTVVQNLTGQSIEDPSPPNYNPSYPDNNVRSDTVYDKNGNIIAPIDTLGKISRTYYDSLNRPETVIQNLVGQAIETETPPNYNPAYTDQNIRTDFVYDQGGQLIATVDPAGIVTRTYYDTYGRPTVVVRNLTGQTIENPTPPAFDPNFPNRNVRTETIYDADGKSIATIDPLERITRTYYDDLEQPYLVVRNLTGQTIAEPSPPTYNPDYPDENVRSETIYDPGGHVSGTIANDGMMTYTCYWTLAKNTLTSKKSGRKLTVWRRVGTTGARY